MGAGDDPMGDSAELRRSELVANLGAVRNRIAQACEAAGRETASVALVAVTKTYPASDVLTLAGLGIVDVGESRDQEARAKVAEVQQAGVNLRWHFLGQLQRNKVKSVAGYAAAVHSVDRAEIVPLLAAGVEQALESTERAPLEVFVQASLDGDPARGGALPEEIGEIADAVASSQHLRLRGLMAVAPLGADPDEAFARLETLSNGLRSNHPAADALSAGMSHDMEAALRHGATHLRIGTALLGQRPPLFG